MKKVKIQNGTFHNGRHFTKGKEYDVSDSTYEAIKKSCEVLEQESEYHYEQNGTWYHVFKGDVEIDHFQGKDKLKEYGLEDWNCIRWESA